METIFQETCLRLFASKEPLFEVTLVNIKDVLMGD